MSRAAFSLGFSSMNPKGAREATTEMEIGDEPDNSRCFQKLQTTSHAMASAIA